MSLHRIAKHLADHGRGADTMLMHVAPDEVAKLQRAAMAQGGSLSINPHTGLPEADFFSDLNPFNPNSKVGKVVAPVLPAAEALALDYFMPGAGESILGIGGAAGTGLLVGGANALMTGSLQKGLMAGLGAYGASSIGSSLGSMGTESIGNAAAATEGATAAESELARQNAIQNSSVLDRFSAGAKYALDNPKAALAALGSGSMTKGVGLLGAAAAPYLANKMVQTTTPTAPPAGSAQSVGLIRPYTFSRTVNTPSNMVSSAYTPTSDTSERNWLTDKYIAGKPYAAPGPEYKAEGGEINEIPSYDPVIRMDSGGVANSSGFVPQDYSYTQDPVTGKYSFQASPRPQTVATTTPMPGTATSSAEKQYFQPSPTLAAPIATTPVAPVAISDSTATPYSPTDTGGGSDGGGGSSATTSSSSSTGSPTGSAIGDLGFALSNLSPMSVIGVVADMAMNAMSPTSVTSVNATNGMDVDSDAATAAGASTAAGANGPAGAGSNGMGSDTTGEGDGSSAGSSSGSGAGSGGSSGGDSSSGGSSGGDSSSGGSGGGDGGGSGADARGGFYHKGQFNYHPHMAGGGLAAMHASTLGGYSDGGRLLRGPGDGMSDNIPAVIGKKQPARLADGEFVIPADVVSHLGNGSTEAGAKQLYKMMDKIRAARTGNKKQGKQIKPERYLPA